MRAGTAQRVLLADGSLQIHLDPQFLPLIESWLPRAAVAVAGAAEPVDLPALLSSAAGPVALIRVRHSPGPVPGAPAGRPTMRLGTAAAWIDSNEGTATLRGSDPRVGGTIDLTNLRAVLQAPVEDAHAGDLYSMSTIAAALLLGRLGRTPIHAGAVLPPGGGAFLLAGDARSGKTTTCVNLITAGWDYLSDDQVVVARGSTHEPAGRAIVEAEGWPRAFHLDEGWERGVPTGNRHDFDPRALDAGRWRRTAPVGGLLFPVVKAAQPTRLAAITPADALGRLLRQTPWLLADTVAGPALLDLLSALARGPVYEISLGLDTYRDGVRLSDLILSSTHLASASTMSA